MSQISIQAMSSSSGTDNAFAVVGALDFATVAEALPEFLSLLQSGKTVALDLAGVGRANSAAVALMVELESQARATDCKLLLQHVPTAIAKIAAVCEVSEFLNVAE